VNECDAGTDNCDINAACRNTEGSFECTCNPGYTDTLGNGAKCDGKFNVIFGLKIGLKNINQLAKKGQPNNLVVTNINCKTIF